MQDHTNTFNTARLLINFLEGNLTKGERQLLEDWLKTDPQNELLFEKLQTDEYLKAELKLLNSFDEQQAFEKIREALEVGS